MANLPDLEISQNGLELIKHFEGFPYGGRPYKDPVGVWTRGYGETSGIHSGSPRVTLEQALLILRRLVHNKYGKAVNQFNQKHSLRLNQNQFDALCSFVYNLGTGMLVDGSPVGDSIRTALKKNKGIRTAFDLYDNPNNPVIHAGLERRRRAEADLYFKPIKIDPYTLLDSKEKKEVDNLLRRRKIAARRGGWGKWKLTKGKELKSYLLHNGSAAKSRAWLEAESKILAALIKVSKKRKRVERKSYIDKVLKG